MKTSKFTKFILLSILSLTTLASCGEDNPTNTPGQSTINVVSILDRNLVNVKAEVLDKDENVIYTRTTDKKGNFQVPYSKESSKIRISNLPTGHYQPELADFKPGNFQIRIPTQVIDLPMPDTNTYKVNDIMYEFTFTDCYGKSYSLKDTLKTKPLVMLNFWATWCGPCKAEFPYINNVYNSRDDFEIFAMSDTDTNAKVKTYIETFESNLDFPMGVISRTLPDAFNVTNVPTTVIVNKYGIVQEIEVGRFASEDDLNDLLDSCLAKDYGSESTDEPVERPRPTYEQPTSETYNQVITGANIAPTYYGDPDEYNWPWIVSEDGTYIKPSNTKVSDSYSILYAEFYTSADEAFAFDYQAHTEFYDVCYVFIDGRITYELYGNDTEFKTCYLFSPIARAKHQIAFAYVKDDENNDAIDSVYIKNLRNVKISEIEESTYIKAFPYDKYDSFFGVYRKHSTAVYNAEDGYYHIDDENGPLVFADLLNPTGYSSYSFYELTGLGDPNNIVDQYREMLRNDVLVIGEYAQIQNNSRNGLVPVTKQLHDSICVFTELLNGSKEDYWLDLCSYFIAVNTDPYPCQIDGLAPFTAFEAKEGLNKVTIDRLIMPKGLYSAFVPEESGVYHFYSVLDASYEAETMLWLYDENGNRLTESDFGERYYMTCEEPDPNFSVYYYLEAGKTYYTRVGFQSLDYMGDIVYAIENMHVDSHQVLTIASPSFFTTGLDEHGNMTNEIIAGGYDVSLEDDGYYHAVLKDGTVGGILYADFKYNTGLGLAIGSHFLSIMDMINEGMFDFTRDTSGEACTLGENTATVTVDGTIYAYTNETAETICLKIYTDDSAAMLVYGSGSQAQIYKGGSELNGFLVNVKPGQTVTFKVASVEMNGSYNVTFKIEQTEPTMDAEDIFDGVDRTLDIKLYIPKMIRGGELDGCVPVDAKLAQILQELMDKYTLVAEHSWTKLCYFYLDIQA